MTTPFDLAGKSVLLIGGRGYIGRHTANVLDGLGATVYSADLPTESAAARKADAFEPAPGIHQYDVDVTDAASVDALVEQTGTVDVLVYGATAKPADFYAPYPECSLEGWQKVMRAELDGLFLVTQRVGHAMAEAGRGSIVCMGSIYGVVGNDQRIYRGSNLAGLYAGAGEPPKQIYSHAAYAAAKGAVVSMVRFLAAYWGEQGVRVNCISPGGLSHPGEDAAFVAKYAARVPLARKAELDEVSGAIAFFASDASSYVSGHNLMVDGGLTAW